MRPLNPRLLHVGARSLAGVQQTPLVELMPQRRHLELHPFPGRTLAQLHQCQVRRRSNPLSNLRFLVRDRRSSMTAHRQTLALPFFWVLHPTEWKGARPTVSISVVVEATKWRS
ncbi:hypothetical protein, partial [Xanthomonas theicola]|uniref:hypothetical protein n=1 Tax=Xanthomonas theicola TaxID=56464 RepID=UPI001B80A32B